MIRSNGTKCRHVWMDEPARRRGRLTAGGCRPGFARWPMTRPKAKLPLNSGRITICLIGSTYLFPNLTSPAPLPRCATVYADGNEGSESEMVIQAKRSDANRNIELYFLSK